MASAVGVKMGSVVAPVAPEAAQDADVAEPGEVEKLKLQQRESGKGKYGSTKAETPESSEDATIELSWIEIEMIDESDKPVAGMAYEIKTSEGEIRGGTLNDKGFARVEGVPKGSCTVSFPRLDKAAWSKA